MRYEGSGENYIMRSLMICTATQCCSGEYINNNEGAGHVAHMEDRRGIYRFLVGKPEGKRPLGRPMHRW